MSFLDRLAAAVMPAASAEDRAEARRKFEQLAAREPLAADILDHHRQIETCFARASEAREPEPAQAAVTELAMVLTGHSMAEEGVVYPGLAEYSGKTHAAMAYEEQAMAKLQLAQLRDLAPLSQDWREKLEHLQSAVEQHVYQEEDSWFAELLESAPAEKKALLTERYREEFGRYCGESAKGGVERTGSAVFP